MKTLYRQLGSSTTGLATASAIFVGLLLYAHYYAFNSSQTIDSELSLASFSASEGLVNPATSGNTQSASEIEDSKPGLQDNTVISSAGAKSPNTDREQEKSKGKSSGDPAETNAVNPQSVIQLSNQHLGARTSSGLDMAAGNAPILLDEVGDRRIYADDVIGNQHHNRLGGFSANRADHRVNYQSAGQGRGRGRGRGEGEFTFDMSFKSRSRMHADMDTDADLHAGQGSYQSSGVHQTQGIHPAYRHYYYGY